MATRRLSREILLAAKLATDVNFKPPTKGGDSYSYFITQLYIAPCLRVLMFCVARDITVSNIVTSPKINTFSSVASVGPNNNLIARIKRYS